MTKTGEFFLYVSSSVRKICTIYIFFTGLNPVVEVRSVFQHLCDELEPSELISLLQREEKEMRKCISSGDFLHLSHLLTILAISSSIMKLIGGSIN